MKMPRNILHSDLKSCRVSVVDSGRMSGRCGASSAKAGGLRCPARICGQPPVLFDDENGK